MADLADDREKRLAELKKEVIKRGFDRHASLLKKISELPVELQSSVVAAHEMVQTIIVFPPQIQSGWHYVPKQALLFSKGGLIHLVASIWPGQEPQVTCLQGCDLMYAKVKLLLLYGLLEIVARGQDSPIRLAMEFNTLNWYYLSAPLQRFLQGTKTTPDEQAKKAIHSTVRQQGLEKLPLKFSNGLQLFGLLPGEQLEELVFQAGTWKRRLYFFRQPVSANTLLLLTSHYLVLIQEELNVKQGWVLSYIPRDSIIGIQSQPCGLWSELSVQLKCGEQSVDYKLILKSEAVEAWRRRWVQHGGRWDGGPKQQA